MNWIKWLVTGLVSLMLLMAASIYIVLQLSLPDYEGEQPAAVSKPVQLTRDHTGYLTITAANRTDAAYSLGYVHAQERYFQMDLSRRNAAGELSALVGKVALKLDIKHRQHRFRQRAHQAVAQLPATDRLLLDTYTQGVNDGLAALTLYPFEYWLLRQTPQPWQPEDTLLTIYSMYLELQGEHGHDEYAMTALKQAVPEEWYQFLQQHSSDWQAALDDSEVTAKPLPDSTYPAVLQHSAACQHCTVKDGTDLGSNNFAVSGKLTPHGSAIIADDMHLGIRVPGTWFKTQLNWQENQQRYQVTGLSLPGAPAIVVGSNTNIAWGFTNSTADWHDLITLTLSEDGTEYLTADGWQPLKQSQQSIDIKGEQPYLLTLKETQWGPVVTFGDNKSYYALKWAAYAANAVNLDLLQLEKAASVYDAIKIAPTTGIPAQNLLVADKTGNIGWSIIGNIPERHVSDWDTAQDWSNGENNWLDNIDPALQPHVINPASDRLWTANARTTAGAMYDLLGNGGYDLGARGQQIRDALFELEQATEQNLHAIQLDHRALMLARWQQLLLDTLTPEFISQHQLQQYRNHVEHSSSHAAANAAGYPLVRAFRETTLQLMFAPLSAYLEQQGARSRDLKYSLETPGWALLQQRRIDTLPPQFSDWETLLQHAILSSKLQLEQQADSEQPLRWGLQNTAAIKHPLSSAIPLFGDWLNMPATELHGDSHMPRVQRSAFGQSQRMVVAPGQEDAGILIIPAGQSGHPLSPFYRADHQYWLQEIQLPFLPGPEKYRLTLVPQG